MTKKSTTKTNVRQETELCKMIEIASRYGVRVLEYKGVRLEFFDPITKVDASVEMGPVITPSSPGKEVSPLENQELAKAKAKELKENYQEFLGELMLAFPTLYEDLVEKEE